MPLDPKPIDREHSHPATREDDGRKGMAHLWGPGKSGNPNGRPKGIPNLYNILVRILQEDYKEFEKPKRAPKGMTNGEVICRMLVSQAADGDNKARTELLNRVLGKPKDTVELTSTTIELTEEERAERLSALLGRVFLERPGYDTEDSEPGGPGGTGLPADGGDEA